MKTKTESKLATRKEISAKSEAVKDLLRAVDGFVPEGAACILEQVRCQVSLVEVADTKEGENACVEKIAEPFRNWGDVRDLAYVSVRNTVRELCHYRREVREQIIAAAVQRAKELAAKAEQLEGLLPQVRNALLSLEDRAQALSHVEAVMVQADKNINGEYRKEVINPAWAEGKAKVSVLRRDSKLDALMAAYDLALEINTCCQV